MDALRLVLEALRGAPAHVLELPPREARFHELPGWLHLRTAAALQHAGIERLYAHQSEALEAWHGGKDVVLSTGTGSGKSLAFAIPAMEACLRGPAARAMLVYPTKALAQDQAQKLERLLPGGLRCAVYDGDTPKHQRAAIRRHADVLLTNPDMLHAAILPQPAAWTPFWKALRLVAVDEAHAYRGVFGSHAALVLRRMRRLCAWCRSDPRFVLASATLPDPAAHAERLCGVPFAEVSDDAGPLGRRTLVCVPALPGQPSPNARTAGLLASLASEGVRTLAFCRSRPSAELVARIARERLAAAGAEPGIVEAYRAGYSAKDRRSIERRLFEGGLAGLATTSAMELGVDVGGLEAVLVNGFPGSAARFAQQAGRTGRGGAQGVVVYLAHADPLEDWLASEPGRLLAADAAPAPLRLENPYVARAHLRCAAWERPVAAEELPVLGPGAAQAAEDLVASGEAVRPAGLLYAPQQQSPAYSVSLRSIPGGRVSLLCGAEVLGEVESWRAVQEAHAGAVYLHRAEPYLVTELDLLAGVARLERAPDAPYYTRPVVQRLVVPRVTVDEDGPWRLEGALVVTSVVAYRQFAMEDGRVLGEEELALPPTETDTLGLRLALDEATGPAEVHACEHALSVVASLVSGSERSDVWTAWTVASPDALAPAVYVLDAALGGNGSAEEAFRRRHELADRARANLERCACEDGCPRCLLLSDCESLNAGLDKAGAIRLLRSLPS